jgi:plastocyanin
MKRLAVAAMLGVCALGACSDNTTNNDQRAAINNATPVVAATVRYTGAGFDPTTVTLKKGEAIVLVNRDSTAHRFHITASNFDSGPLQPNEEVTWAFTKEGAGEITVDGAPDRKLPVTAQPN